MAPAGKKKEGAARKRKKSARCRTCGKAIRIPEGWTVGPAARRHYWRHHPEVMQRTGGART